MTMAGSMKGYGSFNGDSYPLEGQSKHGDAKVKALGISRRLTGLNVVGFVVLVVAGFILISVRSSLIQKMGTQTTANEVADLRAQRGFEIFDNSTHWRAAKYTINVKYGTGSAVQSFLET